MKTDLREKTKRRLALLFCCMVACGCGGMNNARGIFIEPTIAELGISQTQYSLVTTLTSFMSCAVSLAVPHLLLRLGARWVLLSGALVNAAGYCLSGRAGGLAGLAFSFSLMSAGYALLGFTVLFMILAEWYQEGYGVVSSLVSSCYGISAALYSPLFAWIIGRSSWRSAYTAASLIALLLCLPAALSPFRLFSSGRNAAEEKGAAEETAGSYAEFRRLSPVFLLLCVMAGSGYIGANMVARLSSIVLSKGMALSLGAVCTSLAMIGNVLTKMVDGTLSDRFGATRVSALFCFLGAAAEAVIFLTGGKTGLLAASLLMGANYAVSGLSMSLVTMEVYGPKQYGFAYASQVFVCTVLSAVTNLLWGVNYDLAGNYSAIMLFSMGWALLAGISMLLLDRRLRRDR